MFNRLRKLCGRYMRALLPRKLYKLIANGAIIVPAYYKDIIADAETNFDLSLEDTDDKAILLMRKYAHIIGPISFRSSTQSNSIDAKICTYYR